jgi:hypothetical protein
MTRRELLKSAIGLTGTPLPSSDLDFQRLLPRRIPRAGVFSMKDHMVWCASVVRTRDGICHMLFSRWPRTLGFDAWATHSEIAYATATSPAGPYTFRHVALPARGAKFWDGHVTHNPCAIEHHGKFYLYYTGNHGPETWKPDMTPGQPDWWVHRNNQRIGVAVADHPAGPWKRMDKPLLDVPEFGQGIIGVPCVTKRPDGGFLLVYKTLAPGPGRFGGGVFHYPALADNPLGPFKKHAEPLVDKRKVFNRHFDFHIDDHVEWYQHDRYYAIVKDHDEPFLTPHGRCLYLLESANGLDWAPSRHALVTPFKLTWDDGASESFDRLEMPKLHFENGQPRVLFLAARVADNPGKPSFNVAIPLGDFQ